MTQRVLVHVGTPKSGTTFLQGAMWGHRVALRQQGVLIPGGNMTAVFRAAIELRGTHAFWGYDPERIEGTWRRLCEAAHEFDGTTVISHELLGTATKAQADRAWESLEGLETHLVITARDLARQITSEWQERVKNRSTFSFEDFSSGLLASAESGAYDLHFWLNQHLPGIVERWSGPVPAERVHIIVAPVNGPRNALWEMFGRVVGFDAAELDPLASGPRPNETLGRTEVALLRKVNALVGEALPAKDYRRVVKRMLAQQILAAQTTDRLACPPDVVDRLRPLAQASVSQLLDGGYRFHGDPEDLVPAPAAADVVHPDAVEESDLLAASTTAMVGLLTELAAVTGPNRTTANAAPAPVAAAEPQAADEQAEPVEEATDLHLDPVTETPSSVPVPVRPSAGVVATTPGTRRVFLHVGSPKTGTTFLQNVLWNQKELAAAHGLLLPGDRFNDHYLATLDLRGLSGRSPYPARAVGMWKRLVTEASKWTGNVLISHELFAAATAEQAAEAVRSLTETGAEVHVVITARDLVRQLTAEWQEHVKHRSAVPFTDFLRSVWDDDMRLTWFWQVQDFAGVAERWGATIPADRVHLVTVPGSGSPPELLWSRFADLLGLDPHDFDTDLPRSNSSLGAEQAELLRRVNAELGPRLPLPGPYPLVVKNVLAHRILEPRPGTKLALGPEDTRMAVAESTRIADRLDALGIDVVGDLAELTPSIDPASVAEVKNPDPNDVLDEGVAAVADLLVALQQRRAVTAEAQEVLAVARAKPLRWSLVQYSHRSRVAGGLRRVYRKARRRPVD